MTTVHVNPTAPINDTDVEQKLRAVWHRERRFMHTRGLAYFAAAIVVLALASLLIDWLVLLPPTGRWLLLLANVGVLGYTAWRQWWRWLEPYDPVRIALQVEREHPELRSLLVSYVQFAGEGLEGMPGVSESMARAARAQAATAAEPLDFGRIVNFNDLQRLLLISGLTLVLMCGLVALYPAHFAVLGQRMLNPTSDLRYPTRTQLVDMSGDFVDRDSLQQGEPIELWIEVEGLVPTRGELFIRTDDRNWEQTSVKGAADNAGRFAHRIAAAYRSFDYYFQVGDYRSREHRVAVVPPPTMLEARIDMTYPSHTKLQPRSSESLNVSVPAGTKLKWSITYNQPLASATMYRIDRRPENAETPAGEPSPMAVIEIGMGIARLSADRRTITAETVAVESFNYRISLTDAAYGRDHDDDIQHYVHVTDDDAPDVVVMKPGREDTVATVRKSIDIRFRAGDDYAVATAAIVYRIDDGDEERIAIGRYDQSIVEEQYRWVLTETVPGLAPGQVLTWAIEVADSRGDDEPAIGRSAPRRIRVVTEQEYQQYIYEWMQRVTKQLEKVQDDETEGSGQVKNLMQDHGVGSKTDEGADE